jgi:hypothetical protein
VIGKLGLSAAEAASDRATIELVNANICRFYLGRIYSTRNFLSGSMLPARSLRINAAGTVRGLVAIYAFNPGPKKAEGGVTYTSRQTCGSRAV